MNHTSLKSPYLVLLLVLIWSCQPTIDEPEIIDERARMLEVMDYTAQVVSQVMISNDARQEILGYAFEENSGEIEASFAELFSKNPIQRSLTNNTKTGSFAQIFRPRAESYQFEENSFNTSSSADNVMSDLESYLKDYKLALYGPYLAEYHANSTKPITVSFDPLDDSKTTNYGYVITPKNSNIGQANHGGINAPRVSLDENYDLMLVPEIDDAYTQENPTLVIIPEIELANGSVNIVTRNSGSTTGTQPLPIPSSGIRCDDLRDGDILGLYLSEFRLTDNLRNGFWKRNLMDMYAVTKDNISFDLNGSPKIDSNKAKLWNEVRVSRADAKDGKWYSKLTALEDNWTLDQENLFLAFAYKRSSVQVRGIEAEVKGDFSGKPPGYIAKANISFEDKRNVLYSFSFDKCATIGLYKTASPSGNTRNGNRIHNEAGKINFTFEVDWYR